MKRRPATLPFPPLSRPVLDSWSFSWEQLVTMVGHGWGLRVRILLEDYGYEISCEAESFRCPSFTAEVNRDDDTPAQPVPLRVVG
jgi:hypothetical protein